MIQSEYQRFLQTLVSTPSREAVHKFANLILKHIDEIVPLGAHQGQRVKHVAKLAQSEWTSLDTDCNSSSFLKAINPAIRFVIVVYKNNVILVIQTALLIQSAVQNNKELKCGCAN